MMAVDMEYVQELSKLGFVVLPTRNKFPRGIIGWQKATKTWDNPDDWEKATGYCIKTGEISNITVVDIDKPSRSWFEKFWAQSGLPDTTTVETPSGGLHLYYKYDPRLRQTQGFKTQTKGFKLDIDIRNDNGVIVAPNSPYDTDKEEKKKYIGIPYKFAKRDDKELDFSYLRELDEIWVEFRTKGVDTETFLPL